MRHQLLRYASFATFASTPALAYPIDCAILLCLAGGFPASVECTAAKAEFIRRITPFPVEPPLQIWRCPMSAAAPRTLAKARIYDAAFTTPQQSLISKSSLTGQFRAEQSATNVSGGDTALYNVQSTPTGDISDPVYDFVRAIKVWHLDYSQVKSRGSCERRDQSRRGTYDLAGAYAWSTHILRAETITIDDSSRDAISVVTAQWDAPISASIHEANANSCDSFTYRAVVVTWTDYLGNPSSHEVRY